DPKATLQEALDQLSQSYDVQFDVNEKAFKFDNPNLPPEGILRTEVGTPPLPPMNATLGTVLRKILSRIPAQTGATYIIRPDTIEITTGSFPTAEKAIPVSPVAALVLPIPH